MTSLPTPRSSMDQNPINSGDGAVAAPGARKSQSGERSRPVSVQFAPGTQLETVHEPQARPSSPTPKPVERPPRSSSFSQRNNNRLSLSFPVQPQFNPPSAESNTTSFPPTPAEVNPALASPGESTEFLRALAAQERRVLELREELRRAEAELDKLKRQWGRGQGLHRMADGHIAGGPPADVSGSESDETARRTLELDRRRALLESAPRDASSRRKVLRGGHTRTLSLLSPDKMYSPSFPQPKQDLREGISRSSTVSTVTEIRPVPTDTDRHQYPSYPSSVGVKQLAEGFRTGLYNFMEDLRQATVGDEAINGVPARTTPEASKRLSKKVSKGSLGRRTSRSRSPNPLGSQTLKPQEKAEPKSLAKPVAAELDDADWDNWESPSTKNAQWPGADKLSADQLSSYHGEPSKISGPPSDDPDAPLPSVNSSSQRPELSWPALNLPTYVTPTKLKKTAEAFMREWERSLAADPNSSRQTIDHRADTSLVEGL